MSSFNLQRLGEGKKSLLFQINFLVSCPQIYTHSFPFVEWSILRKPSFQMFFHSFLFLGSVLHIFQFSTSCLVFKISWFFLIVLVWFHNCYATCFHFFVCFRSSSDALFWYFKKFWVQEFTLPSMECVPFHDRCAPCTAYITEAVVSFRESHPIVYFLTFSLSSLITIYTFPQAEGKKKIQKVYSFLFSRFGDRIGYFQDCHHFRIPYGVWSRSKQRKAPVRAC